MAIQGSDDNGTFRSSEETTFITVVRGPEVILIHRYDIAIAILTGEIPSPTSQSPETDSCIQHPLPQPPWWWNEDAVIFTDSPALSDESSIQCFDGRKVRKRAPKKKRKPKGSGTSEESPEDLLERLPCDRNTGWSRLNPSSIHVSGSVAQNQSSSAEHFFIGELGGPGDATPPSVDPVSGSNLSNLYTDAPCVTHRTMDRICNDFLQDLRPPSTMSAQAPEFIPDTQRKLELAQESIRELLLQIQKLQGEKEDLAASTQDAGSQTSVCGQGHYCPGEWSMQAFGILQKKLSKADVNIQIASNENVVLKGINANLQGLVASREAEIKNLQWCYQVQSQEVATSQAQLCEAKRSVHSLKYAVNALSVQRSIGNFGCQFPGEPFPGVDRKHLSTFCRHLVHCADVSCQPSGGDALNAAKDVNPRLCLFMCVQFATDSRNIEAITSLSKLVLEDGVINMDQLMVKIAALVTPWSDLNDGT